MKEDPIIFNCMTCGTTHKIQKCGIGLLLSESTGPTIYPWKKESCFDWGSFIFGIIMATIVVGICKAHAGEIVEKTSLADIHRLAKGAKPLERKVCYIIDAPKDAAGYYCLNYEGLVKK